MATRKITLALLQRKGACRTERDLFAQQYLVDIADARCKRSIAFARAFGEAWCT